MSGHSLAPRIILAKGSVDLFYSQMLVMDFVYQNYTINIFIIRPWAKNVNVIKADALGTVPSASASFCQK